MKIVRALVSGLVGAVATVLLFLAAHVVLGPAADPSVVIGQLVLPDSGAAAWALGALLQLVLGTVTGIAYAIVFEFVFRHAGWLAGIAVAIPHVVVAGLAVAWFRVGVGPYDPALAGAFLAFAGLAAAVWFVAAHCAYGAIVGACYGATRHRASAAAVTWHEAHVEGAEGST